MLFLSEKAKEKVSALKSKEHYGDDYFLRISVTSGGCSGLSYQMHFDNTRAETDEVFESQGIRLVTDRKSVLYLFGTTLDFSDGLEGKGFFFNNPNATRTCSCGESFAV